MASRRPAIGVSNFPVPLAPRPFHPNLYIVNPTPDSEDERLDDAFVAKMQARLAAKAQTKVADANVTNAGDKKGGGSNVKGKKTTKAPR